jgi:hypothetical protein
MAHGDSQRRGGELGDASTLLTAQIAEDAGGNAIDIVYDDLDEDVMSLGEDVQAALDALKVEIDDHENVAGTHPASKISVDSSTLVGVGTTAQAVFEELDDAVAAAAGGYTVVALAADASIVGGVEANLSGIVIAGAVNEVYHFEFFAHWNPVANGDSASIKWSKPTGASYQVIYEKVDSAVGTVSLAGGTDVASAAVIGTDSECQVNIRGFVTFDATHAGNFQFIADAGSTATLKKGSVLRYKRVYAP